MFKAKDIVRFLLHEPRAFKSWTVKQIYRAVASSILSNTLYWSGSQGQIHGVCFGYVNEERKVFHVIGFKLDKTELLRVYIREFGIRFPGYKLIGYRHGKPKNLTKLCKRFY